MQPIRAYALCGAAIAATATFAFLQFPGLLIWCAFLGWAGFLHSGGDRTTILPTVLCMLFGATMAWLFAVIVAGGYLPLPLPVAAALLVAAMAPVIIGASRLPLLGIVPASFYGFASCFAFLAQSSGQFTTPALTTFGAGHVLVVVPVSMVIGVALGWLQTVLAQALLKASTPAALDTLADYMGPH